MKENVSFYQGTHESVFVFFQGNLYNRPELLPFLEDKLESEAQLIFELFKREGTDFASNLLGEFAIFIYDKKKHRLFLIRDHLGTKPLSCAILSEGFLFGNDGVSISKILGINQNLLKKYLVQQYQHYTKDYHLLPSKKVFRILPGHFLEYDFKKSRLIKYWEPESISLVEGKSYDQHFFEIRSLVENAVKVRSQHIAEFGVHYSGGIDSALIATITKKLYPRTKPKAFAWIDQSLLDSGQFEADWMKESARILNIDLMGNELSPHDYVEFLKNPWNMSNTILEEGVRQKADQNGVEVILSGWGGDEFISIDNKAVFTDLFFSGNWKSLLQCYPISNFPRFIWMIYYHVIVASTGFRVPRKLIHDKYYEFFKKAKINRAVPKNKLYKWKTRNDLHRFYLYNGHIAERLEDWYINGQLHGLEYRYPLLDKRIVEYMFAVPSAILVSKDCKGRGFVRDMLNHFFKPEQLQFFSKRDSGMLTGLIELESKVNEVLINELKDIENCDFLDFIDFEKLKREINFNLNSNMNIGNTDYHILTILKKNKENSSFFFD
ncbi:asparagine synthase-related protein [Pararhodonellum marinum]|uniref:asparagine synthase-related protein n=1 Tax=Pararhodonellum marinum TaxID=2755358 RepID=UPI00188E51E1|nr:asparagine synthetase B family protein [Pararhodonellum marinum]